MAFHGLVQVWLAAEGDEGTAFRVRRSELKLTGLAGGGLRWTVQFDPSSALSRPGAIFQDGYITAPIGDWALDAGRFKVPIGEVGTRSSSRLETIERPRFAAAPGKLTDLRDVGIRVRVPFLGRATAELGLFNGLGEAVADADDRLALAGRIRWAAGPSGGPALGVSGGTSMGGSPARRRLGGHLAYEGRRFTGRLETLLGTEGEAWRRGEAGLIAYRLRPALELVARVDAWRVRDPEEALGLAPASARDLTLGATYILGESGSRVQANYVRRGFGADDSAGRNLFLVNFQAAW